MAERMAKFYVAEVDSPMSPYEDNFDSRKMSNFLCEFSPVVDYQTTELIHEKGVPKGVVYFVWVKGKERDEKTFEGVLDKHNIPWMKFLGLKSGANHPRKIRW